MPNDNDDEDLMTRKQVAEMFRTTPQVVAYWARRGTVNEVRTASNKHRNRRGEVQALWDSGLRW